MRVSDRAASRLCEACTVFSTFLSLFSGNITLSVATYLRLHTGVSESLFSPLAPPFQGPISVPPSSQAPPRPLLSPLPAQTLDLSKLGAGGACVPGKPVCVRAGLETTLRWCYRVLLRRRRRGRGRAWGQGRSGGRGRAEGSSGRYHLRLPQWYRPREGLPAAELAPLSVRLGARAARV